MGKGLWVESIQHSAWNENPAEVQPNAAKLLFSNKVELQPLDLVDSSFQRHSNDFLQGTRNFFFARIGGGFPEDGVKWVVENFRGLKLKVRLPENFSGAVFSPGPRRVSVARKGGMRHQVCFARISDHLDPETQEKLEDVKEDVEEKLEDLKEDTRETAQQARVPVPSATLPYIGFVHSLTIKNLLCGVLAGAVASTLAVPFGVVRTRVIAGQGGQSVAQVVSTAAREEGIQSLFKGSLKFNIILSAIQKGLQFTTFEAVKRSQERNRVDKRQVKKALRIPKQIPLSTLGGAAAGFVGTLLSYPMQPVFDRLLLQPDKYTGIRDAVLKVVRNEGGIRELYRGITPALISTVPQIAVSFYTYETLKTKYLEKAGNLKPEIEALRSLIIGGIAGAVSTAVTYPLDLARKEIVLSSLSSEAVHFAGANNAHYRNTWQALKGIAKANGLPGLYRGFPAEILQIVPVTAVTFLVYELAKRAFVAVGEEERHEVKDADDLEE